MSNEDDFVASLNRLETLIDSNQAELKRDVELLIDRRFGSLREEVAKLKSSNPSLGQITNLLTWLAEEDSRRNSNDLPDRIRDVLSTITSNKHVPRQTHDLGASEISANVESVNIIDELYTEGHVNRLETNVPSTGTTNDAHLNQIDIPEGGDVLGDKQNEYLSEEPNETNPNCEISAPASPSIIPLNIKVEGSSSPQSVRQCKPVKTEVGGEENLYCDCGSNECIIKQEIKEEFDETEEIEIGNNGQSVQLGTQVKDEVKSGEEYVIGAEDGDELNVNPNESLHEQSNGSNQHSVNDNNPIKQQVGNVGHEPNKSAINECNESQTLKQSKFCKRKRTVESLATKSENLLENSLTNRKVSTQITIPRSKRIRVTSPLERGTTEQLSTGSEVDSSEGASPNGDDPRGDGEVDVEQSEDDERLRHVDTEMDDEEGGNYKIEAVNLKCHECAVMVADKCELSAHFRDKHHTSLAYRCLANGCTERFGNWTGQALAKHVQDKHSAVAIWPCPHCTKTFKTQRNLYQHMYNFHFEGQFKCAYEGCHHKFIATVRSEIRKHQHSVHRKTVVHKCQFEHCGKLFNNVCHLRNHQRIHQGVKPYKCTWNSCGYVAAQCGPVITHIRTRHFHLPASQKEQLQRGIEDNRNPRDYLQNTTQLT